MSGKICGMFVFLCCVSGLAAQSGKIVSPQPNEVWVMGSHHQVRWTFTGNAMVKLQLFNAAGVKLGAIKSGFPLTAGSFSWTVGRLENGKTVPPAKGYRLKMIAMGNPPVILHPNAGPFEIAANQVMAVASPSARGVVTPVTGAVFSLQRPIRIYAPKAGDVWKPMANYAITWEAQKNKYPASAYDFNVLLIAVKNPAPAPRVLKTHHWAVAKSTAGSNIYSLDWKFLGSMNIPSGQYKVAVRSVAIAGFQAESGPITVQNSISANTGFIGESEPELLLEDVFYNAAKQSIWARIRNQGFGAYKGPLTFNYHFTLGTLTYNTPACGSKMDGETKFPAVTLNRFQSQEYLLCKWPCFDKRPADFIPVTGPISYQVLLSAPGKPITSKTGALCKCKGPDVIAGGRFLLRGKGDPAFLLPFQQRTLSTGDFHWISDTTFEARVEVDVWNWGCQGKTFEIKLHMDGNYLNGQKAVVLGKISLAPGQKTAFTSPVLKFSFPKDGQYYRMLLVADPGEINSEGYPDAYKNNFILAHVRFGQRSNTVTGRVSW